VEKLFLVLNSIKFLCRILWSIQPTMTALLATGTTLPSLQTPERLQLIKGGTRKISFCTSFPPSPYNQSTLCCSTKSIVESYIALPTKWVEMYDDSSSLLACLWPLLHHSWDEIIDHPQKTRANCLETPMATILDSLPCELASIDIKIAQCQSNDTNRQLLEPSLAPFQNTPYPFDQPHLHQLAPQASPEQAGISLVGHSSDVDASQHNLLTLSSSTERLPVDLSMIQCSIHQWQLELNSILKRWINNPQKTRPSFLKTPVTMISDQSPCRTLIGIVTDECHSNDANWLMIIQANNASSTLALHSSDSHPPVDLAAIQQEIQSNMQALTWLFPVIIKHNNTALHLETKEGLKTAHKTKHAPQQPTRTLAAATTNAHLPQLHPLKSDHSHLVKIDCIPRDLTSLHSCSDPTYTIINKLNNLTNQISCLTEQMAAAHPSAHPSSWPPVSLAHDLLPVLPSP